MKIFIYTIILVCCFVELSSAQDVLPEPVQTWMSGSGLRNTPAVYGEKGVSNTEANPGSRSDFAYWTDLQGNFWVFGGFGYGEYDENDESIEPGILGDLWKFDRNSQSWIWMGGSKKFAIGSTAETELFANYGEIGVSSSSNWPSATRQMAFTLGEDGNLYMFGGEGFHSGPLSSRLNQLWKYDIIANEWTFLYGKMTYNNDPGIYGIKNVESESNSMPARLKPGMWTDSDNNVYIFGGYGYAETSVGFTNDLWKFNTSNGLWTWIGGSKLTNEAGVYGTKGIASVNNIPPSKWDFAYAKVSSNEVHLFGGEGPSSNLFSDLWKYDISSSRWTWLAGSNSVNDRVSIHGDLGIGSDENSVSARRGMAFTTDYPNADNPSLYIFGGNYRGNFQYNDLWKYDKINDHWVWMGGSNEQQLNGEDFRGNFGSLGVPSVQNNIPHRSYSLLSIVGDEVAIFGGKRRRSNVDKYLNDLWTINLSDSHSKWIAGDSTVDKSGKYGPLKVDVSTVSPGARNRFGFTADANNRLWLYGGIGFSQVAPNVLTDLWMFDSETESWLWVDGTDEFNQFGNYDTDPFPGSRAGHIFEGDSENNLWLIGGYNVAQNAYLSDVWKYDINEGSWSLMKGDNKQLVETVYGEIGVPSESISPGARASYASAMDEKDNIWLFGGSRPGDNHFKNDLWKFDTKTLMWTWVSGSTEDFPDYVAGDLGEANKNYVPAGRSDATMAIRDDKIIIFGGKNENSLNDLWIYDIQNKTWAWHYGELKPETETQQDERIIRGVEGNGNTIGTRVNATSTIDENGDFWIFATTAGFTLNESFWKFNPTKGLWTWMAGFERPRDYGVKGVASKLNQLPKRDGGKTVLIGDQVYYYGAADGFDRANQRGYMDDLWRFDLLLRNNAPTDLLLSQQTINENEVGGLLIGKITGTDADENELLTYELSAGEGDTDNSSFSIVKDELYANTSFNFEEKSELSLRIKVIDKGNLFYEKVFIISIIDMPDAPTDLVLNKSTIAENKAIGSVVGNFIVTDEDVNDHFQFNFVSGIGDSHNEKFAISNGQLITAEIFDFEALDNSELSVRISVTDRFGLSFEKVLTIKVLDVNDPPTDIFLSENTIFENEASDFSIGILSAEDQDANDNHTFEILANGESQDHQKFAISGNQLRTVESLNYEKQALFNLTIRAIDEANDFIDKSFEIQVLDVAESPTDIILSSNAIEENVDAGTLVAILTVADDDENENHTYSLVDLENHPENENFSIENDQLKIAISPDFEEKSSYLISIEVTDKDDLTFVKVFTINIVDINESPTDILLSNQSIEENQPENALVGIITVIDEDLNDTFILTLEAGEGSTDNSFFLIEDDRLMAAESFDFEDQSHAPNYSIRIKATDAGGLSFSKVFSIEVLDVKEAPTAIILSNNTINEVRPAATLVGSLTSLDPDDPTGSGVYQYEIIPQSGTDDHSFFEIEVDVLQTTQTLFFANRSSYELLIQTTDSDGLSFSQLFEIEVIPIVDNEAPVVSELQLPSNSTYLFESNAGEISFTVSDNYWVEEVQLFHKKLNESQFTTMNFEVKNEVDEIYKLSLTDEIMGISGLVFYIQATDSVNNTFRTANQYVYVRYAEDNVPSLTALGSGGGINDYRMFSIPFELEDTRVDNIFAPTFGAYNQEVWRVFHYDNGRYLEFQAGLTNIDKGKGYWFNSTISESLNLTNIQFPAYTNELPFQMTLRQGWNQVGNPYNFELDWSNVLNQNGINAEVGSLKIFNGSGYVDQNIFKPFEGAFVFAEAATVLNIPMSGNSSSARNYEANVPSTNWELSLEVNLDGVSSNSLKIGMLESNQVLRAAAPPKFLQYFELASVHPTSYWKTYEKDFVGLQSKHQWTVEWVQNTTEQGKATMSWTKPAHFSEGQLLLIDEANGVIVDMIKHQSYSFSASDYRKFDIYYAADGVDDFDFSEISVGSVYPNPVDHMAHLPVLLPETDGQNYQVELLLYDLNGRQIGNLFKANVRGGHLQIPIDASEMSEGVYLYRLLVEGNSREVLTGKFIRK